MTKRRFPLWALLLVLFAGGTATAVVTYRGVIYFGDGSGSAVSASNTGAIRYNNSNHLFESSTNGGSWTTMGGGGGGSLTETLTADAAVGANLLIKPSATTNDRYILVTTADLSQVVVGNSTTSAAGAGNTFTAATIFGQERSLLSDGTATITRGQILSLSTANAGYVYQSSANPICVATTSAAASLGAAVSCR
jgi:hypothetical protein